MMAFRSLLAWILVLVAIPVFAADVDGFRVWTDPEKTRAVLDLTASADYQLFTLSNPPRVVIDLKKSSLNDSLALVEEHAGVINGVRHGAPDKDTLRIVLDLKNTSDIRSFLLDPTGDYGYRLVVDLFPKNRKVSKTTIKQISALQKPDRDIVIAIDAGHGGEDPGATGKNRTREKDVVLALARELKKSIDAQPGMSGVLTRNGDYLMAHPRPVGRPSRETSRPTGGRFPRLAASTADGKIDEIIDAIDPEMMMILINAVYFNCVWEVQFDPEDTREAPFYREDKSLYGQVEMMELKNGFISNY